MSYQLQVTDTSFYFLYSLYFHKKLLNFEKEPHVLRKPRNKFQNLILSITNVLNSKFIVSLNEISAANQKKTVGTRSIDIDI
jgi:hypothetical protein